MGRNLIYTSVMHIPNLLDSAHEVIKVLHSCNVVVVSFKFNIWIDISAIGKDQKINV